MRPRLATLALVYLLGASSASSLSAMEWSIEPASVGYRHVSWPTIEMDSLGAPIVAFSAATYSGSTMYRAVLARRDQPSVWHCEEPDSGFIVTGVEFAFDGSWRRHVAFVVYEQGDYLKYGSEGATGWLFQYVDHESDMAHLALDDQGNPHFASSYSQRWVHHVTLRDSAWQVDAFDSTDEGHTVDVSGLELDPSARPHVVYTFCDIMGGVVESRYAFRDSTGWIVEKTDSTPGLVRIAVDSAGRPHLGCGVHGRVYHFERAAHGWIPEFACDMPHGDFSFVLDRSQRPAFVLIAQVGSQQFLELARKTSSEWVLDTILVASGSGILDAPVVAFDTSDVPHVAFRNAGDDRIYYAEPQNMGFPEKPGGSSQARLRCSRNPSSRSLDLTVSLPSGSRGEIEVYDAVGRRVRAVTADQGGTYRLSTDGTGDVLPSGVYLCVLRLVGSADRSATAKVVKVE